MTKAELFSISITEPDPEILKRSKAKWDGIAKPIDGLGSFEEIICRIAAVQGNVIPAVDRKAHIIMCADNGIFEEGVSQTSQKVTRDVAELMGQRKSSVGMMAAGYPIDMFVYDIGINSETTPEGVINAKVRKGTENFLKKPAMEETECLAAIETGIDAVKACKEKDYQIISTGEMGIANTTTSTALLCALKGLSPKDFTGKGAGLTDSGLKNKIQVIEKGISLYRGVSVQEITSKESVFEIARSLGGLDIAGLTGVFIGGAIYHIPIVIDGVISAVSAMVAERLVPGCRDYMLASHMGREQGMKVVLEELSLKPIIHANLALGEGTGAIMLFPMLDMAMSLYRSGTSFRDTDIDQYERFDK
ncbi:MAG: nicotinate-nucleotide--dimethylbenzimidazole phosphoribosyltransferase [Eubacterium sp.]|nr:nicotinate-nucleotide--dimethylbenzimidazole phosphoribosyltransferase [Eubacterium sp.]